jgi:hypothetical protein
MAFEYINHPGLKWALTQKESSSEQRMNSYPRVLYLDINNAQVDRRCPEKIIYPQVPGVGVQSRGKRLMTGKLDASA